MQPQQKALPGSYYAKLIGSILFCILGFALILLEIFDIFHPIDVIPINAAIHLARIIILLLLFIFSCVLVRYGMRFERAKALGIALDFPKWFLLLNQWGLKRWTLKNAVSVFILVFTGSVIFQILTPISESPDMAWVAITASLYASFVTFAAWIGHRRRVKMETLHPAPF